MNKKNGQAYPLNALEKNILAWETAGIAFNSHMIVDFRKPLEVSKIINALGRIFTEIPLFRTLILRKNGSWQRFLCEKPWFQTSDPLTVTETYSSAKEEEFLNKRFDLSQEPPLRVFYAPLNESEWRLILSVHHSACDGIGQTYLLQQFFLAYEGRALSEWALEAQPLSLNQYLFQGPLQVIKGLFSGLRGLLETKRPATTLLTDRTTDDRTMAAQYFRIGKLPFKDVCAAVLWALQQVTENQESRPLTLVVPVNLRPFFRLNKGFQNFSGICRLEFSRDQIRTDQINDKLQKLYSLRAAAQSFYSAALAQILMPTSRIEKKLEQFDKDPEALFSSAIISVGRLPAQVKIPAQLEVERIFGRGALFKSPGLGVTVTGTRDNQILVVQYLKSCISEEVINKFIARLKENSFVVSVNEKSE